ncbi:MAG TPA: DUF2273 domain-containing protein [Clostridia bacterium]|nr:DUF2273 domain-containing protein [Clostridia bacterium]
MADPNRRSFWQDAFRPGTTACAVLCSILGIAVALSLLLIGFWKTLLLSACFGVGWFLGAVKDKPAFFRQLINRWFRSN